MQREKISGLPIVDMNNRVIDNISVSDLKVIGYDATLFSKVRIWHENYVCDVD